MKKKNKRLILFLLFAFTAVSCAKGEKDASIGSSEENFSSGSVSSQSDPDSSSDSLFSSSSSTEALERAVEILEEAYASVDLTLYGPNGQRKVAELYENERASIEVLSENELFAYTAEAFLTQLAKIPTWENMEQEDLFISEIFNIGYDKNLHPAGNNNDKAIELYNPLNDPVSLTGYTLELYSNGLDTIKSEEYRIVLDGTIEPHTAYLIVHSYASEALRQKADRISPVFLGAKSSVALYKNDSLLDVFGTIGANYASDEEFVIDGIPGALNLHNLIRKAGFTANYEFVDTQWEVAFDEDYSTLGVHVFSSKTTDAAEALSSLVAYWYGKEVTGNIELITDYQGYRFSYDFYGYYYDENGQMLIEPEDGFELSFALHVLDENNQIIASSYEGYVIYRK